MGTPPPDAAPRQKIVMGYPSMDRYNLQAKKTYPQPPSPPAYPVPQGYPSPSFHQNQGYPSPSFQAKGKFLSPASQNPYSPSFNESYYQQPYKPLPPDSDNSSSFSRVMLILMMVLVSCMCMMSLVMWFLFGTYIPDFQVVSLNVSNFTATDTSLAGVWDAGLTIKNSNDELKIQFEHVRASIFYREVMLGISHLQPCEIPSRQMIGFNASVSAQEMLAVDKAHSLVLPSLAKDRSNGVVVFSLRLAVNANFTSPSLVYRQESLRVSCDGLHVSFSATGEGILTQGAENGCLISIRDTLD